MSTQEHKTAMEELGLTKEKFEKLYEATNGFDENLSNFQISDDVMKALLGKTEKVVIEKDWKFYTIV